MDASTKRLAARVLPVSPEGRVLLLVDVSFDLLVEDETGNVLGSGPWTPSDLGGAA